MAEILKDTTANKIGTGDGGITLDPAGTEVVTISNGVVIPDGTKAAPSIRLNDDQNTGIFSPTNDSVSLSANGEEVLRATGSPSAVNYFEAVSSGTGADLVIKAVGTDTDIDIDIQSKGAGQVLINGSAPLAGSVTASQIDAEASTDGYVLTSDGAGNAAWEAVAGGGASVLNDLTDVVITTPSTDQVLSYNGTNWVNATASGGSSDNWMSSYGGTNYPVAPLSTGDGTYFTIAIGNNTNNSTVPVNDSIAIGNGITDSGFRNAIIGQNLNVSGGDNFIVGFDRSSTTTMSCSSVICISSNALLQNLTSTNNFNVYLNSTEYFVGSSSCLIHVNDVLSSQTPTNLNNLMLLGSGKHLVDTNGEKSWGSVVSGPDAKTHSFVQMSGFSTNSTPTVLSSDGNTGNTSYLTLINESVYRYIGTITAKTNTDVVSVWDLEFAVKRNTTAGSTAFVGTPTVTLVGQDVGASSWDCSVSINTTRGGPDLNVTGDSTLRVEWFGSFTINKCCYN